MTFLPNYKLFDSHFHIIDKRFPLFPNQGFLPAGFTCTDYRQRLSNYHLAGGAIVSGSFQGFDQSYLLHALKILGPQYVGVTQLPASASDDEILKLNDAGVRGVRFNLKRGGSEGLDKLEDFAHRVFEVAGWHVELYADTDELGGLTGMLMALPRVSIAHLGLSAGGFPTLLKLVESGVKVKATGFYRVDFDVKQALQAIAAANQEALLFGTDLPSTRASRPYSDNDFRLVVAALGTEMASKVFYDNAVKFYQPAQTESCLKNKNTEGFQGTNP